MINCFARRPNRKILRAGSQGYLQYGPILHTAERPVWAPHSLELVLP